MKRPKKQGSRRHMTPLERGLTVAARREGKTWEYIAEALNREPNTLRRAVRIQALHLNAQFLRKGVSL